MNGGLEFCVYKTPCDYCSKFDKWCDKCKKKENKVEISPLDNNSDKLTIENLQNTIEKCKNSLEYDKNFNIKLNERNIVLLNVMSANKIALNKIKGL